MKYVKLSNGIEIPQVGFGTFKIEPEIATKAVYEAISVGYTHIDAAMIYKNETEVGEGIKQAGIKRSELFLTSKLWNDARTYEETLKAFDESLKRLKVDYLDLYLIHWPCPIPGDQDAWRAMEKLYNEGLIKAIGVCNYKPHHFEKLLETASIQPMLNQVELHPQFPQEETRKYCHEKNIAMEAWGSLMQGAVFTNEIIAKIAEKHQKSVSQITIRWAIELGLISIPKSINIERMKQNIDVFDFTLDADDMKEIEKVNTGVRIGSDPDTRNF